MPHTTDMVAAVSLGQPDDEVSFQWCSKPPYEEFSTDFVESSNESIEDLLNKYKRRAKRDIPSASSTPIDPTRITCDGVRGDVNSHEEMGGLLRDWVQCRQDKEAKLNKIRVAAAVLKNRLESEAKKQEALDRKMKIERKKALHHIPDSRERREAERRLRKKYTALQAER